MIFSASPRLCGGIAFLLAAGPARAESLQQKLGHWFAQGESAQIEEAVSGEIEDNPGRPELWLELASLRKSLGDYSGAIQAYQNYLARREDWRIETALALAWVQKGELDNARNALEKLRIAHAQDPAVLWGLARLELREAWTRKGGKSRKVPEPENLRGAQKYLKSLTESEPDFALGFWELAEVSRHLGDKDEALEAYSRTLKRDASFKEAHRHMAKLLAEKGDVREALAKYQQAMAVDPDDEGLKKEAKAAARRAPEEALEKKQERMKQWRDWVPPEEMAIAPSPVTVRVGLAVGAGHLLFRSDSNLLVTTPAGTPVTTLASGGDYHIAYRSASRSKSAEESWTLRDGKDRILATFSQRLWITPENPLKTIVLHAITSNAGYFFAREEDRAYRGVIEISPRPKAGFQVINLVSLEAYLAGVLPAEMPPQWPLEALEAQAVVARTYALSKMGRHNAEGFDLCDSVHCQVYRGMRAESQRSNEAVNRTAGWILKHDGKLLPVAFSAQCGGHTQDYEEAWGYPAPVPGVEDYESRYNQEVDFPLSPFHMEKWIREDPVAYCRTPELPGYRNYRWSWILSAGELEKRAGNIGRLRRLQVTRRSSAGWAQRLLAQGSEGSKEFKGDSIRRFLGGIRSNLIWIEPQFNLEGWPEEFVIYGGGWGHGVGMCQVGCYGLARAGRDFKEIVRHYFPKGTLEKLTEEKLK